MNPTMTDPVRVLYVDDEESLLELATLFLEKTGEFSVGTSVSAETGRKELEAGNYAAVVSDYQMPGEDGIMFLKSVRAGFGDIPFILFTGKGREEVVIEAINNGADFYLQKGGDPAAQFAELAHKIRQAVNRRADAIRRKNAEDALRESEARFSLLFQSSPVIISFLDAETNTFVDINDAFVHHSGYSRQEVIGRTPGSIGMFVDPDVPGQIRAELMKSSRISAREVQFRNKDRQISTCLLSAVALVVGGRQYILSSAEDISGRKAMETELRESRSLLAEAMDLARLADWEWDHRTRQYMFNDRFYALYGTTAEREGGYRMDPEKYFREFVHPEDREMVMQQIKSSPVLGDRNFTFFIEHRIIRRDGAVRYVVVRMKVDRNPRGEILWVHGVNQDVTDSRKAGDASRQSRLPV